MSSHDENPQIEVIPVDKSKVLKIWKVAGILALVTLVEYAIAFSLPAADTFKYVRIWLFIILTIVKAYYIMSEFMHLGHEKKSLQYSIIFPLAFLAWAILAFLMESSAVFEALKHLWNYTVG